MKDEPDRLMESAKAGVPVARQGVWGTALAVLAIVAVGALSGLPSLPEPFGVDQGIYAYIADRLREGAVDHREVFDHKPPGIHFAYAAAFELFGRRMWSIRLLDLLAAIGTALGLYALGRRAGGWRLGLWCGLLYVPFYAGGFDWLSRGQPETWVNLTFVWGLALAVRSRARPGLFAAGLLLGAGFWFKPTVLLPALLWPALMLQRACKEERDPWRRLAFDSLAVAAGFAVALLAVLSYYVHHSALRDLYEAVVVFNARYHTRLGLLRGWSEVWRALAFLAPALYSLLAPAGLSLGLFAFPARRGVAMLGFGWLLLTVGSVFWQGSFARSHYVLALPPLVFLAGALLAAAMEAAERKAPDTAGETDRPPGEEGEVRGRGPQGAGVRARGVSLLVVAGGIILLVANLSVLFTARWTKFSALAAKRISTEQYYASFWLKGVPGKNGYSFEDLRDVAAYLEANTRPDQTIFVWGFRPLIAWLANRRMPTRFSFRYPLTRTGDARWWAEFLNDLNRTPPAYFVVVLDDRGFYHPETSKAALENNGALTLILSEQYAFDRTMTDFEIYRRRAGGAR